MSFIIDNENLIFDNSTFPDPLRAEIGFYYSIDDDGNFTTKNFSTGKISQHSIVLNTSQDDSKLKPQKSSRIYINGSESEIRDHAQWEEFIKSTISINQEILDHKFSYDIPKISIKKIVKNFHLPTYEDETKVTPTKQLINYNLNKYIHLARSNERLKNIATLKTSFDVDFPNTNTAFDQFPQRLLNLEVPLSEYSEKQRFIHILYTIKNLEYEASHFPYYYLQEYDKKIDDTILNNSMFNNNKLKNVFKNLTKPQNFSFRSFNIDGSGAGIKIYDFYDVAAKRSIHRFSENNNETFLLEGGNSSIDTNYFSEGVQAMRFLSETRVDIKSKLKDIEEVFNSTNHSKQLIGYKIEKYINNDATTPIQTYYTINNGLLDSQLKYSSKYIYKTYALVAIHGSSYRYTNVVFNKNRSDVESLAGDPPQFYPADKSEFFAKKYWCYADVTVQPSLKIAEIEMERNLESFIDSTYMPPYVTAHVRKNEPFVHFIMNPRFFKGSPDTIIDFPEDINMINFDTLSNRDRETLDNVKLSNSTYEKEDYFTGIYEIYRINTPPMSITDFKDQLIATVDEKTGLVYKTADSRPRVPVDNMNGYYSDRIMANKKYYYLFRSLSYHGTPSESSDMYEVELIKDSDEYKLDFKEYKIDEPTDVTRERSMKRILQIEPNYTRLLMELGQNGAKESRFFDGELVDFRRQEGKTFKIRLTSKHTGKKIDINVTFKVLQDGTFDSDQWTNT